MTTQNTLSWTGAPSDMDKLTWKGLMDLTDRLRRIHPELDPSWANLIGFYADAWMQQLAYEEKRANEFMLEKDSLARDAWRREKGLEDGVFQ